MMPQVRHRTVFLLLALSFGLPGCDSSSSPSVADAMRQIAPEGGSGVKHYDYKSGELMKASYWERYRLVREDTFDKSGNRLLSFAPDEKSALQIMVDEDGAIKEICQVRDLVKEGYCFKFEHGRLTRVQEVRDDVLVMDVDVATPTADASAPKAPAL